MLKIFSLEFSSEFSLYVDCGFDRDFVELVTPGTHMTSGSERDNGSDEEEEENLNLGLEGVSSKFVWQNIGSFPTSRETFCNMCGPKFHSAELYVLSEFESIFHIVLMQLIVDESYSCAEQ
jgi:hypothetical protein